MRQIPRLSSKLLFPEKNDDADLNFTLSRLPTRHNLPLTPRLTEPILRTRTCCGPSTPEHRIRVCVGMPPGNARQWLVLRGGYAFFARQARPQIGLRIAFHRGDHPIIDAQFVVPAWQCTRECGYLLSGPIRISREGIDHERQAFLPIGSSMPPPATAGLLLHKLVLTLAYRDEQVAGIREWLKTHEPSDGLVKGLKRRGYGQALDGIPRYD